MTGTNKTVLLTGGLGYIGSHCAAVLAEAGYQPILLDNLSNAKPQVHDALQAITGKNLPFIQADVRDTETLASVITDHQVTAVMHFAGLKAVGESVSQPIDYYDHNVAGAISLLKAMQQTGVQQLVFSSSATVYGDPDYLPIDEAHPTRATNPYGRSKLHIEQMLADVAASDPAHWRMVCLRYFNPVGAHASGLIGEDPSDIPNNLMPYIAQVASGQLQQLSVFGDDYPTKDGTGVRDYIHVMDLASGHQRALAFLAEHTGWHAINLGTGQGYSVLQMVKAFEQASGQSIPYQITDRRPGDIASCYADPSLAEQQLGWRAELGLQAMCESTWRFQQGRAQAEQTDQTRTGTA